MLALGTQQTHDQLSQIVIWSLLFQGAVVCCLSFLVWFWLLRQYSAVQLGSFSFLTPLFGIVFAYWLLNEPLEQSFISGAALVLFGILLVTGHQKIRTFCLNILSKKPR